MIRLVSVIGCLVITTAASALDYTGLDSAKFLGPVVIEATVTTKKYFTEGPAMSGDGDVFFTNTGEILKFSPKTKTLEVFRKPSTANGSCFDVQGCLMNCEAGDGTNGRVTRTDLQTGKIEVLCDSFGGFPLGGANDLTIDSKGRIYFTSRLANTDPAKGNVNAVYRIDPDGKTSRILAAPEIDMPNGLAVSPDEKTFYLIEADGRAGRARNIRAYDLQPDGSVTNRRVLVDLSPGRSGDGMELDEQGNLYVAAGLHKPRGTSETLDTRPGLHVFSPQGKLLAFVDTGRHRDQLRLRRRRLANALHHLREAPAQRAHDDPRPASLSCRRGEEVRLRSRFK